MVQKDSWALNIYGYDTADQLTSVQYNCTNPDTTSTNPSQTVAYTYDNAGNRTQVLDSVNGTTAYTPNADNQYTTVGANTASYDGRGNLTALGGTTYSYDASNRLTSYSDSFANSVTQAYDPLGRCVKRTINGVTTFFVYDLGWRLLNEYNSSGGQVYRYVNGPAANEIVSRTDSSSNVIYYHTDGLGSITKLTSSTGALIEQYSYDAFGQTTIQNASGTTITSSAYGNRFMYTGAELVAPMNLYNNRNRFYSPSLGRFLQPDPIGHAGDGYNIYRYCGNNPVNATDPSGKDTTLKITLNSNSGNGGYGLSVSYAGVSYTGTATFSSNGQDMNISLDPTSGTSMDTSSGSGQGGSTGSGDGSDGSFPSGSSLVQPLPDYSLGYYPDSSSYDPFTANLQYSDPGLMDQYQLLPSGMYAYSGLPPDSEVFQTGDGDSFLAPSGTSFTDIWLDGMSKRPRSIRRIFKFRPCWYL